MTELNEVIYAGAKINLWQNRYPPKEPEQKYKTWMRN